MLLASQTFGQFYYYLETGLVDKVLSINDNYNYAEYNPNKYLFYTDIMLGYEYKKIHIETNLINIFDKADKVYFSPCVVKYDFRMYYQYKNMKIGYEHSCSHCIYNQITIFSTALHHVSYDKFFIRYEFKE
jgi:hypothetical protein